MVRLPLLFMGGILLSSPQIFAAETVAAATGQTDSLAVVAVRAGAHEGYDRIVFDWPRTVSYKIQRQGERLIIEFGAAARFSDQPVHSDKLKRLRPQTGAAGHRYELLVAAAATIKDSRNGQSIIVDVGGAVLSSTQEAKAQTAPPGTSLAATVKTKDFGQEKNKLVAEVILEPLNLMSVSAGGVNQAVAEQVIAPTTLEAEHHLSGGERAALLQNSPSPMAATELTTPAIGQQPVLLLQLNPGVPLGFAAYVRGGYGYLVLQRRLADSKKIISGQNAQLQLQPLNLGNATGWRFVLPAGADLRADRNGNTWTIYLAGEKRQVPITLALVAEPNYALGARLFLPTINPPEVVHYFDPVIGDELSVVPLLSAGDALTTERRYADFTALPTAQGLVIAHTSDNLSVRTVPNGVEIGMVGGLHLSPARDTNLVSRNLNDRGANKGQLFDFASWRGLSEESFTKTRQRLLQNIVDVPANERDRARLELARFYFAHGFAAEALALLNYMQERLPDLFARPEFRALRGASLILANNPAAGLQDFTIPDLKDVVDRPLWEALAQAQLRDYAAAAPKFNATIGYIEEFPDVLFNRFALMALESQVATDQTTRADQWLEDWRLSKHHEAFLASAGVEYMRGVVSYSLKNSEQAVKHWRIAAASQDKLYRTRAELALVDYDLSKGKLTAIEAAQRLEGLRFAWRGDPLEWEILRRLGLYYFQAKKYRDGFINLERARRLYPDQAGNVVLAKKLSDVFHDLYTTDMGVSMTPLEALSLYQDYRYLVTDVSVARPIMYFLTERLVAIDLLEQAEQLLQDLMLGSETQEKAKIGARLAGICLLDRQPVKAIAALDASQSDGLPADVQQERLLLRARALIEQGQSDAAKALLVGHDDKDGQMLLADMAWRNAQWAEAASALRRALGGAEVSLSPEKAQLTVRAATAYALAGDQAGLQQLTKDFGAAMRLTNQSALFTVLTEGQDTRSLREMAAKIGQSNDNDMFKKFLERYRNPAADSPIKDPARTIGEKGTADNQAKAPSSALSSVKGTEKETGADKPAKATTP